MSNVPCSWILNILGFPRTYLLYHVFFDARHTFHTILLYCFPQTIADYCWVKRTSDIVQLCQVLFQNDATAISFISYEIHATNCVHFWITDKIFTTTPEIAKGSYRGGDPQFENQSYNTVV